MRTGLLVSLLVHGAAAAALALWGTPRAAPEPLGWLTVSTRAEEAPEPELAPGEEPSVPGPPRPAECWPIPEEEPAPPEIEAPEVPVLGRNPVTPVVRLPRPLSRPARSEPPAVAPLPAPAVSRSADTPPRPAGVLVEPRRLPDSPRPRYPARALRLGLEGTVMLLLRVAADGTVERVAIETSSGHEILDRAAAEAAPLWRFEPARRDGVAVASDVRVPVEFTLEGA